MGSLVAVALLALGAVIGFILARLASRRIPDDDLAMVAYAVNIVTLVGVPLVSALMFWL